MKKLFNTIESKNGKSEDIFVYISPNKVKVLNKVAEKGNANTVSDIGVASLLASAACKGALFNVEINVSSLPEEMGGTLKEEAALILESSRILSRACMDAVRERL